MDSVLTAAGYSMGTDCIVNVVYDGFNALFADLNI